MALSGHEKRDRVRKIFGDLAKSHIDAGEAFLASSVLMALHELDRHGDETLVRLYDILEKWKEQQRSQ